LVSPVSFLAKRLICSLCSGLHQPS
jgi:hypothetical protein